MSTTHSSGNLFEQRGLSQLIESMSYQSGEQVPVQPDQLKGLIQFIDETEKQLEEKHKEVKEYERIIKTQHNRIKLLNQQLEEILESKL